MRLAWRRCSHRKMRARSEEDADDELLSVVVAKGGKKVVVGSQSGVLNLYSWGYWKDCSDRWVPPRAESPRWGSRGWRRARHTLARPVRAVALSQRRGCASPDSRRDPQAVRPLSTSAWRQSRPRVLL